MELCNDVASNDAAVEMDWEIVFVSCYNVDTPQRGVNGAPHINGAAGAVTKSVAVVGVAHSQGHAAALNPEVAGRCVLDTEDHPIEQVRIRARRTTRSSGRIPDGKPGKTAAVLEKVMGDIPSVLMQ